MGTSTWTVDDKAIVLELWRAGHSASEISRQLHHRGIKKSRNAVISVIYRMNVTGPRTKKNRLFGGPPKSAMRKPRARLRKPKNEPAPIGPHNDFGVGCKYLHGNPSDGEWQECGHPRAAGSPYCAFHENLCYVRKVA